MKRWLNTLIIFLILLPLFVSEKNVKPAVTLIVEPSEVSIDGWNIWVNETWAANPFPENYTSLDTIMMKSYTLSLTYSDMRIFFSIGESTQYDTNNNWWGNVTFWNVECTWSIRDNESNIIPCRNSFGTQDFPTTIYTPAGPQNVGCPLQKANTSVSTPEILEQGTNHTLINTNITFADLKLKTPQDSHYFLDFDAHFAFYIRHDENSTSVKV